MDRINVTGHRGIEENEHVDDIMKEVASTPFKGSDHAVEFRKLLQVETKKR